MLELKGLYEIDSNNIIGFYVEGHINKEEFLQLVEDSLEDYFDEDEIEDIGILTLEKVEHLWYKQEEDYEDYYGEVNTFLFSNKEKDGYFFMTKYEF